MADRNYSHEYGDDRFSRDEAKLFHEPDVLCVDEFLHVYQGRPAETPERRLVAAVLRDAIDCYLRDCFTKNRHRKRSFREAEEWFFRSDDFGVFSLENVCGILNIDPGYIRRSLLQYERQQAESRAGAELRLAS
ncbi:MAG TPA: hypothetical protein VIE90_13810 [Candidatus Binatia bacterium]|jgi:hypothetical protein